MIAIAPDAAGRLASPVLLAEFARAGLREHLAAEITKLNAEPRHGGSLRLVDDPFQTAPAREREMLVWASDKQRFLPGWKELNPVTRADAEDGFRRKVNK